MIVVFGAAGFIGSYLTEELVRNGLAVLATDTCELGRAYYEECGIPFQFVDVTRKDDFMKLPGQQVETVINLACVQPANVSEKKYNPVDYMNVNVIGVLNILEYCRRADIPKMIFASSHRNTKGLWKEGKKIREEEGRAIDLTGEYAMFSISESAAEDCIEHYNLSYGLQGIVFRFPPVYGYGPHTVIFKDGKETKTGFQTFIDSAISGKPIEIWGNPDLGRDIIYVKDVVRAFVLALNSSKAVGLYNISSGKTLSIREQVEETVKAFGKSNEDCRVVYRPEMNNSIEPFVYDNTKAKRDFGWAPRYNFGELLTDYKKEMESGRFDYLIEKRRQLLEMK